MSQLMMYRLHLGQLPQFPALLPDYLLRPYRPDDLHVLAQTLCHSFDDLTWNAERVQCELIDDPSVRGTFVVEYRGLPVATASAQLQPEQFPGSGCLHWVAVDPRHQGNKLGYVVSLAILHAFVGLRCHDALLFTDDHRLAAIKTYLALGFEPRPYDETHGPRWAAIKTLLGNRTTRVEAAA